MKKGCLTVVVIFLAICLLFGMCSSNSDSENTDTTSSFEDTSYNIEENITETSEDMSFVDDETMESSTEEFVEETVHTHYFRAATCTEPKTCSCGATEGGAKGHSWENATCTKPKTCSVCGTTSGLAAGHNFSNGNCTICDKEDPDYVRVTMVWIPTNGGTKYHTHAGCSNMDNPEKVTQSEAESRGFTPCKRCH